LLLPSIGIDRCVVSAIYLHVRFLIRLGTRRHVTSPENRWVRGDVVTRGRELSHAVLERVIRTNGSGSSRSGALACRSASARTDGFGLSVAYRLLMGRARRSSASA